jgi:hypothetical protein
VRADVGFKVAGADLNGDGLGDLIVGEAGSERVHVVYGGTSDAR